MAIRQDGDKIIQTAKTSSGESETVHETGGEWLKFVSYTHTKTPKNEKGDDKTAQSR